MAEQYKHFLSTGSGRTNIELNLNDDLSFSCHIDSNWMGSGKRIYQLGGTYKPISPVYGWLVVNSVQNGFPETTEALDFSLIGRKYIIVEYFKIEQSPQIEHPSDLGLMQQMGYASWPEKFDFLLLTQNSDEAYLHYLYDEGYVVWDEETNEQNDKAKVEIIVKALLYLDRKKFSKV